jgi:hypothetical protein
MNKTATTLPSYHVVPLQWGFLINCISPFMGRRFIDPSDNFQLAQFDVRFGRTHHDVESLQCHLSRETGSSRHRHLLSDISVPIAS